MCSRLIYVISEWLYKVCQLVCQGEGGFKEFKGSKELIALVDMESSVAIVNGF